MTTLLFKKQRPGYLVHLIGVPLFLYATTCAAVAPQCPESITPARVELTDTPAGWTASIGSRLYLHSAAPTSGPPEERGELAGFRQSGPPKRRTYSYDLAGIFPAGKWLACRYGTSDEITLARRLDDDVRSCSFTYQKGVHVGQNQVTIACNR